MAGKEAHMNARAWKIGALALLVVPVVVLAGWAQGNQVYPQGLIIDPPTSQILEVSITTDKPEYQEGESVTINYEVNKAAYIYIWDIPPIGDVEILFPRNDYPGGMDNYVQAGAHQLPITFRVEPPYGTEYLQILATTQPVDIASFPMSDPALFQQQVEVQILGLIVEAERTWSFTSFEIVEATPSDYATLIITSTPTGASISIDGAFVGYTPRTHYVSQGFHRISISKSGYTSYDTYLILFGTGTRTIDPVLTPLFPTNAPPIASFTYSPPNPVVGSYVQFNAMSSVDTDGSIIYYQWSFGDGTTGSGAVISHWFTSGGALPVTLTVTDNDGAADSMTQTVQVGPTNLPPVASFTVTQMSGGWMQLDASASYDPDGTVVSYLWDTGDGSNDSGPVVWHRYTSAGPFLVALTVVDNSGASAHTSQLVQIAPTNTPPTAAFTYTPIGSGWVRFDASTSSDSDGVIVTQQWSFGDGASPQTGVSTYHQFPIAGTYLVTLTVTDDDGATGTVSQVVDLGPTQQPPIAVFTYSPLFPQVGQVVTLSGVSSSDPDGSIISYLWDRDGDGLADASGQTVQATYSSSGAVPITLTVTDNDGLTSSATQAVVISSSSGPAGAPSMGTTAGVYVWGTDRWHVTVNAGAGWFTPHSYRLELRTDETFENINDPSSGSVFPMGLVLDPAEGTWTVTFEGSITSGSVDHTFRVPDSDSVWMSLKFDIDGDGVLDESSSFVYLRHSLVRPPSVPMVVGLPRGSRDELLPTVDFRIGTAARYTETSSWIFWTIPSISAYEGL